MVWRRESAGGPLTVTLGAVGHVDLGAPDPAYPDVVVRGRLAKLGDDWLVTLFLVNDQEERASRKDEAWLFQAELAVSAGGEPVFVRRRLPESMIASPDRAEARTLEMAYRDEVEFAVGHGIAVRAEAYPPDPRTATRIVTVVVPRYEVPRTDAPSVAEVPELAGAALDMAVLADARDEDLAALLSPLADAYEAWIGRQQARIADPGARLEGFEAEAGDVLGRCRHAAARIRTGITLLGADPVAAQAFRFANRAMWQQRVRSMVAERRRRDAEVGVDDALAEVDVAANRSWRPFQLAFVLLNLPSLTDPTHAERAEGTGARRPAVVSYRRRQDGGLPRPHGVHPGGASTPGRRRRLRRPRRRGGAYALHAAPADHPAVPASGSPDLRVRVDPQRRPSDGR